MMRILPVVLAALAGLTAISIAQAAGPTGSGTRPVMMARIYTSEVPSSVVEEGRYITVAVIIPPGSKVAKVEAFMDEEDFGRSIDRWRPCDLDTGNCELEHGRVEKIRRLRYPDRDEVMLDFWNDDPQKSSYAKLRVTFLPTGNLKKLYVPRECWLRTECGYAGWMDQSVRESG